MESRIAVIDDDENMRELLTLCFRSEGWQVIGFTYDALNRSALEEFRPNLIILDFSMRADQAGWAILQSLKMSDSTARIPVLVTTTAFRFSAEQRGYLMSRLIEVVSKPFDLNSFLMLISKALTRASQAGGIALSKSALPVLVVEDVRELREAITTILELEGYAFVTARNGQEALESLSRGDHSLILLDIAMPVMNGLEFIDAYSRQADAHIPVIILSGEIDIRPETLPPFVVGYLRKPFEIAPLIRVVKEYAQPFAPGNTDSFARRA